MTLILENTKLTQQFLIRLLGTVNSQPDIPLLKSNL